jgi:hypothetical protein
VLSGKRVAYFFTAMNLTRMDEDNVDAIPVWVDAQQAKPPKDKNRLSLKERYATVSNYLRPVLKAAPLVKPVSVGFFGGKLEMFRLPFLQMLFVLLIIQAQPGDFRHWPLIREWAAGLQPQLLGSEEQ